MRSLSFQAIKTQHVKDNTERIEVCDESLKCKTFVGTRCTQKDEVTRATPYTTLRNKNLHTIDIHTSFLCFPSCKIMRLTCNLEKVLTR